MDTNLSPEQPKFQWHKPTEEAVRTDLVPEPRDKSVERHCILCTGLTVKPGMDSTGLIV